MCFYREGLALQKGHDICCCILNSTMGGRAVCKLKDFLPESTEPEVILRLLREHNYDVWAAAQVLLRTHI